MVVTKSDSLIFATDYGKQKHNEDSRNNNNNNNGDDDQSEFHQNTLQLILTNPTNQSIVMQRGEVFDKNIFLVTRDLVKLNVLLF